MDRKRRNRILKYAVSLAVAGVLLYFSFRGVEWEDFIVGLKSCRWELIAVSMAASVMAFWFRAVRWKGLIRPIDSSIGAVSVFNAINIGYIANFVFPRIGEFVRCGVISGHSVPDADGHRKASYDKVLGTVVLERGWDMLTMLVFMTLVLVTGWDKFGSFFMEEMWEPVSGRFGAGVWWLAAVAATVCIASVFLLWRFRGASRLCGKVWGLFSGLMQGMGSCFRMEHKWKFIIYTLLIWGMYWLMSWCTMKAMPALDGLGASDALFLMVAGSLGWLVPVPGGFGAFHFVVSLALSTIYGVPFETGIVFAALSHESQAITMLVCGGGSYIWETVRRPSRSDLL